jgi:hypothetical protein
MCDRKREREGESWIVTTVLANVKTPHFVQRDCTKAGISVLLEKSAFDWEFS